MTISIADRPHPPLIRFTAAAPHAKNPKMPDNQGPDFSNPTADPATEGQQASSPFPLTPPARSSGATEADSPALASQGGYWLYYWVNRPIALTEIMDPIAALVRQKRLKTVSDADIQGRVADSFYIPAGGYVRLYAHNEYMWHNRLRVAQDMLQLKPLFDRLGLQFSHAEVTWHKTPSQEWEHDSDTFTHQH
jgi:hypothetical protein